MPRIPQNNLPRVAPGQAPGVRLSPAASPEAFGYGPAADEAYGQARGLSSDAARMLMEEHAKQQREADEANVNDAIVRLAALKNKLVFDPNGGLYSKRGDAAAAAYQPTMQAWMEGAKSINDSLVTNEQRALFQKHLVGEHVGLDGAVARYVGGEIEAKKLGSAAAAADTFGNDAIAMATVDPLQVGKKLADQRGKLEQLADLKGITDPVARENFLADSLSKTNLGVVKAMVTAGQDLNASEYFKTNKDAFRGGDLIAAQAAVGDGSTLGEAQRTIDGIISKARQYTPNVNDNELTFGSEKDAMDAVRAATEGKSPQVRAKAEDLMMRQFHMERLQLQQSQNDRYEAMAENLRKGASLESLERSDDWNGISEAHKESMERMANNMAKSDSPYAKYDDPAKSTDFWDMSHDEMVSMSKAKLTALVPYVTQGTFEKMQKHWSDARNKEVDFTIREQDERYMRERVALAELGGLKAKDAHGAKLNEAQSKSYLPVAEEIRNLLQTEADKNKGHLPQEKRRQIINDYVIEKQVTPDTRSWGTRQGWKFALGAPFGPGWAVLGGGLYGAGRLKDAMVAPSIPDTDKERLRSNILRSGGDPSEQRVQMLYLAEQKGASGDLLDKIAGGN
jgi:cyclophilin family peptidyl-prolyl cis-trans isomerase